MINRIASGERGIALDPSYIPKAGKSTYGRGKYWSGVAKGLSLLTYYATRLVTENAEKFKEFSRYMVAGVLLINIQIVC